MDCGRIPAADRWEKASSAQLEAYQAHLRECGSCRERVFLEAPEHLLFQLSNFALPEDFWLGFWPSLQKKLDSRGANVLSVGARVLRWAAVFGFAVVLVFFSRNLPAPKISKSGPSGLVKEIGYPLVEEVQNPKATYYIFQSGSNEKIVMVIDPDMDL